MGVGFWGFRLRRVGMYRSMCRSCQTACCSADALLQSHFREVRWLARLSAVAAKSGTHVEACTTRSSSAHSFSTAVASREQDFG